MLKFFFKKVGKSDCNFPEKLYTISQWSKLEEK